MLISVPFHFETEQGDLKLKAQAAAAQNSCVKVLRIIESQKSRSAVNTPSESFGYRRVHSDIIPDSFLAEESSDAQYASKPTVMTLEPVISQESRELIPAKKTGEYWFSKYKMEDNDIQGDLRSVRVMFGPQLSYYLGYRMIAPDTLTIPRVRDLMANIKLLNHDLLEQGVEPISLSFYEIQNEVVSSYAFLKRFGEEKAYPIGRDQHVGLHDHSYHVPSLIVPNQLLDVAARTVKFYLKLHNYLLRDAGLSEYEIQILSPVLEDITEIVGKSVDYGMGNLTPVILHLLTQGYDTKDLSKMTHPLNYLSLRSLQDDLVLEVEKFRVLGYLLRIKDADGEALKPNVKSQLLRKYGEVINQFYDRFESELPQAKDFMNGQDVMVKVEQKLRHLHLAASKLNSPL